MTLFFCETLSLLIFYLCKDTQARATACFFAIIPWVALFTFRDINYGQDITYYYEIFLNSYRYNLDEQGLFYLNKIISSFSKDLAWFNFTYSILLNLSLAYLYRKIDAENGVVFLLLFFTSFLFFQINLNIYRQGLACILIIIGLIEIKKKPIKSICLLLIAYSLHKASVVGIIFYIASYFRFNQIATLVALFSALLPIIFTGAYEKISSIVTSFFPIFERSVNAYIFMGQSDLIKSSGFDHRNLSLYLTLLMIYRFKLSERDYVTNSLCWCFTISIIIASLFTVNVLLYLSFTTPIDIFLKPVVKGLIRYSGILFCHLFNTISKA